MRRRRRHRHRWRFRLLSLVNTRLFNLVGNSLSNLVSKLLLKSKKVEGSNEFERKVREIYELLPKRDCGACGYGSCYECAIAIAKGEATLDTCKVLRAHQSSKLLQP